jgi:hypothetical protein
MYVDLWNDREAPVPGWYLQAIGRKGALNSAYFVLTARRVKRRDPKARPRIMMEVELVDKIPAGAKVFEFYWYERKKKRKVKFEDYIARPR